MMTTGSFVPLFLSTLLLSSPSLLAQDPPGEQREHEKRHHRFFVGGLGRGYLGVQLITLTPELRAHFGVSEEKGILVARVVPDSPAAAAGIKVGDILTAIDGERIDSARKLSRRIRRKEEGDSVRLELWRDGKAMTVFATIAERKRQVLELDDRFPWIRVLHGPKGERFEWRWNGEDLEIDEEVTEAIAEAMERLKEHVNSEAWQERLEQIESMDWDRIQGKMKDLEERLKDLEEELAKEEKRRKEKSL